MAKQQANLPSTAFKEGWRGNISIANIANDNNNNLERDMEELILDARTDEHGKLNEEDLRELRIKVKKWLEVRQTKIQKRPINATRTFGKTTSAEKHIKDEMDDVCLTAFFQSIKRKYAGSTLWVIYSYINSHTIDKFGANLKNLVRLTKYIKTETSHYVAKKSKIFSAEQIHEVISHCMYTETNDPKLTLYGVCIAVMYYGQLRMNEAFLIKVEDVRIVGEEDFEKIKINFNYQRKGKTMDLLTTSQVFTFLFSGNTYQNYRQKCKNKMLPSKLERTSA